MRVYLIRNFKRQRSLTVNKIIKNVVTAQSDTHNAQRRFVWIFRPTEYLWSILILQWHSYVLSIYTDPLRLSSGIKAQQCKTKRRPSTFTRCASYSNAGNLTCSLYCCGFYNQSYVIFQPATQRCFYFSRWTSAHFGQPGFLTIISIQHSWAAPLPQPTFKWLTRGTHSWQRRTTLI